MCHLYLRNVLTVSIIRNNSYINWAYYAEAPLLMHQDSKPDLSSLPLNSNLKHQLPTLFLNSIWNSQYILKKNKIWRLRGFDRIFDFKNIYKSKTVWYWPEDRHVCRRMRQNTVQNFRPTLCCQMIFNKDARVIQHWKGFSINDFGTIGYPFRKKTTLTPSHTIYKD